MVIDLMTTSSYLKRLVQLVGHEFLQCADGPIDLRTVSELIEKLSDDRLRKIPFDDEFIFDLAGQWVLFPIVVGARRIIAI